MMEDVGTSANNIIQLDSNAKIPAVDGSLVTGVTSGVSSSSDPTISTNPSGGVGTKYKNTTSGEMYICTNATAGQNTWTNVGGGTGNVAPWFFGGDQYGYQYGGNTGPATSYALTMEKWSLASDADATAIGDMAVGCTYNHSCQKSSTHGYISGGYTTTHINTIQKWPFTTDGDSTDIADLTRVAAAAAGSSSTTHCYTMCGGTQVNVIDKFPTATDANATDVGDCPQQGSQGGGATSETHGYKLGGWTSYTNIHGGGAGTVICIQKVSFASDGNATDVAHLFDSRSSRVSSSSETHGYLAGGEGGTTVIDKHNFASGTDSTDVGDCPVATYGKGGCASSVASGYYTFGILATNSINKYSHISDGNATDIADMVTVRNESGGCHY